MPINKKYLFSCIMLSLLLCFAQIRASTPLILACLGGYLLILGWACAHHMTLPVLIYFLPWSTIMKLSPGSYSFYTFGLVLSCGISMLRNHLRLKQFALLAGIGILFSTLLSKLLDGYNLDFSYIAFMMMLVALPSVKQEIRRGTYDFYQVTVFLSLGIILAAMCALEYAAYSNIARYIDVSTLRSVVRRSGFYGDANFYAAQITAVIAGCMVLLLREVRRDRIALLLVLTFWLVYCGALSTSKSFVLTIVCMVLVWIGNLLRMSSKGWLKIFLLLALAAMTVTVITSELFRDLVDMFVVRFSGSTDLDSFTTKRVGLWESYFSELFMNAKVFFLGVGLTNVKVNGRGSHNTILQIFYQLGLIGAPFLIYWVICFLRDAPAGWRKSKETRRNVLLILLGVWLPWMGIDELFADDFFLLQWYAFMAMYDTSQPKKKTLPRYPVPPVTKPAGGTLRNTIHE